MDMGNKWLVIAQLMILCSYGGYSQDYGWWNEKHHWDGTTHWSEYLITSAAFMGPNALPVQDILKGELPFDRSVTIAPEGYFGKGELTGDLFTRLFFPLFTDRAGLGISYVVAELYKTDTLVRDMRRSREYDPRGYCFGDVYFSTYIQLIKDHPFLPDLMFSANIKTASGTEMKAARNTNGPGYYFDLSAGKEYSIADGTNASIRPYLLAGFYAYQTNLNDYLQDDAITYGAGVDLKFGLFRLENQVGGYRGYLDNGDRPVVYRLRLSWERDSGMILSARFQQGISDFLFTSVRVSTLFPF